MLNSGGTRAARLTRLAAIAGGYETVLDIGCDHGKLERLLIEFASVKKIVASDISRPSLDKCVNALAGADFGGRRIDFRLGDGLKVLKPGERADLVVIAGMGGMRMIKILTEGAGALKGADLLLSPHRDAVRVAEYCAGAGYRLKSAEKVAERNKEYGIMLFTPQRSER